MTDLSIVDTSMGSELDTATHVTVASASADMGLGLSSALKIAVLQLNTC